MNRAMRRRMRRYHFQWGYLTNYRTGATIKFRLPGKTVIRKIRRKQREATSN